MTSALPPAVAAPAAAALAARVRFVLVQPSHAGNIGAAARAVKSMGFDRLHVVAPQCAAFANDPAAVALATHGADVLAAARTHATLEEALAGVSLALAMTGYAREFGAPLVDLRGGAALAADEVRRDAADVAFVFGTERSGLTNAQVEQCQRCCAIPADPQHGSLNLAQAVMVTAYECRLALLGAAVPAESTPYADDPAASVERLEAFYAHLERALIAAGFLDGEAPKKLMPRLRRLFARARPSVKELDILRGICATLEMPKRERIGRKGGG
ncbi:MAG: RNA methyltransferase [Burkholderiaceae bacterium]|nr:RNA methyltransferase [Burkholderiaceae bacterium]